MTTLLTTSSPQNPFHFTYLEKPGWNPDVRALRETDMQYASYSCETHNKSALKKLYSEIDKNGANYMTNLLKFKKSDTFSTVIEETASGGRRGSEYIDNKYLLPYASNTAYLSQVGQLYCFNTYVLFKEIILSLLLILYIRDNPSLESEYKDLILVDNPTTQKRFTSDELIQFVNHFLDTLQKSNVSGIVYSIGTHITQKLSKGAKKMLKASPLGPVLGTVAGMVVGKGEELINDRIQDKLSGKGIWDFKEIITEILQNGEYDSLYEIELSENPPPEYINAEVGDEMASRSRLKYKLLGARNCDADELYNIVHLISSNNTEQIDINKYFYISKKNDIKWMDNISTNKEIEIINIALEEIEVSGSGKKLSKRKNKRRNHYRKNSKRKTRRTIY